MRFGRLTAAELIEILSAPFFKSIETSFTEQIPPPTVNGISIASATFKTSFDSVLRFCSVADISKNTNSSAL